MKLKTKGVKNELEKLLWRNRESWEINHLKSIIEFEEHLWNGEANKILE